MFICNRFSFIPPFTLVMSLRRKNILEKKYFNRKHFSTLSLSSTRYWIYYFSVYCIFRIISFVSLSFCPHEGQVHFSSLFVIVIIVSQTIKFSSWCDFCLELNRKWKKNLFFHSFFFALLENRKGRERKREREKMMNGKKEQQQLLNESMSR